jgi:hypothetical protein
MSQGDVTWRITKRAGWWPLNHEELVQDVPIGRLDGDIVRIQGFRFPQLRGRTIPLAALQKVVKASAEISGLSRTAQEHYIELRLRDFSNGGPGDLARVQPRPQPGIVASAWQGSNNGAALFLNNFSGGYLYPDWAARYKREGGDWAWWANYSAGLGADALQLALLDAAFARAVNTQWFTPRIPTAAAATSRIAAMSAAERTAYQGFRAARTFQTEAEAIVAFDAFNAARASRGLVIGRQADVVAYGLTPAGDGLSILNLAPEVECTVAINNAWLDGAAAARLPVRVITNTVRLGSRLEIEMTYLTDVLRYTTEIGPDGLVVYMPPAP